MDCICGCKQQWHMNAGIARAKDYETAAEAQAAWNGEGKHYVTYVAGTACLSPGCDCRRFTAAIAGTLANAMAGNRAAR